MTVKAGGLANSGPFARVDMHAQVRKGHGLLLSPREWVGVLPRNSCCPLLAARLRLICTCLVPPLPQAGCLCGPVSQLSRQRAISTPGGNSEGISVSAPPAPFALHLDVLWSTQALQKKELTSREACLNGIAWDPEEDVLYLTGAYVYRHRVCGWCASTICTMWPTGDEGACSGSFGSPRTPSPTRSNLRASIRRSDFTTTTVHACMLCGGGGRTLYFLEAEGHFWRLRWRLEGWLSSLASEFVRELHCVRAYAALCVFVLLFRFGLLADLQIHRVSNTDRDIRSESRLPNANCATRVPVACIDLSARGRMSLDGRLDVSSLPYPVLVCFVFLCSFALGACLP